MPGGVRLRQDTGTALPELTEQHRIRMKEEELGWQDSVQMAESETKCTAPRVNTLEPMFATAHRGVNEASHTDRLIKTETDMDQDNHTGYVKMESLDPDQIKIETVDEGYVMTEHINVLQDIKFEIKSEKVKFESSEILVSDPMDTVLDGTGVDDKKGQTESLQCIEQQNRVGKETTNHVRGQNMASELIQDAENSAAENPHQCAECGKCFSEASTLQEHLQIHKLHKCTHCEKSFVGKYVLAIHERIHTGDKLYKCDQCERCFSNKGYLTVHQRMHTGERPYKCTHCEKSFVEKYALAIHERIHAGERPYKCTDCGKSYLQKSTLTRHQRIHTGEKPYKCDQCERCFLRKAQLIVHQVIHTGEKPFKCPLCGKCFVHEYHLNIHLKVHNVINVSSVFLAKQN